MTQEEDDGAHTRRQKTPILKKKVRGAKTLCPFPSTLAVALRSEAAAANATLSAAHCSSNRCARSGSSESRTARVV